MATYTKAYVYKEGRWVLVGTSSGGGAAIVSVPTPPAQDTIGQLWINPSEIAGDHLVTDVLAAIKGQTIAPKAIDLDGPNTLYISANPDGTVKLALRVDNPIRGILEESVATEEWVTANSGNIHVGNTAPITTNTLWLNPTGTGTSPLGPFFVGDTQPAQTDLLWLNPKA